MSTARGIDPFLSVFMSLPVLIGTLLSGLGALALLLWRGRRLGVASRAVLLAVSVVDLALAAVLIALAFAFGSPPPPPPPPMPIG